MGSALIVTVKPEEQLAIENLLTVVHDEHEPPREVRLRDLYDANEWFRLRTTGELFQRHPDAYFRLTIPYRDVWDPPGERGQLRRGPAAARRKHTLAARASLQAFLNARLAQLEGMVRTGWWILGRCEVAVTRMEGQPDRPRLK